MLRSNSHIHGSETVTENLTRNTIDKTRLQIRFKPLSCFVSDCEYLKRFRPHKMKYINIHFNNLNGFVFD